MGHVSLTIPLMDSAESTTGSIRPGPRHAVAPAACEQIEEAAEDPLCPPDANDPLYVSWCDQTGHLSEADQLWLTQQAHKLMALVEAATGSLSVAVVDDATMSDLHERFSGVAGTTDVLTFDLREEDDTGELDGEVVLCLDVAQREAATRGHDTRDELLLYLVHGVLHLLGEDDREDGAFARMHARENDLLTQLGVGALFDG